MEQTKSIYELLSEVQSELKAPKDKYNSFGKYHYRSTEAIVEAVKPLLHSRGMLLNISDWMEAVGNSVYVMAKATVYDKEGNSLSATAGAREAVEQKGMADAQVTGSTSTYARKYALNGLFAIDDTKDSDDDHGKKDDSKIAKPTPAKTTTTPPSETGKPASAIQPNKEFEGDTLESKRDWKVDAKKAFLDPKYDFQTKRNDILTYVVKDLKLKTPNLDSFIENNTREVVMSVYEKFKKRPAAETKE